MEFGGDEKAGNEGKESRIFDIYSTKLPLRSRASREPWQYALSGFGLQESWPFQHHPQNVAHEFY